MENSLQTQIETIKKDCIQVGMKAEVFMKEVAFAVQIFQRNTYLNSATEESKKRALYNVALTGLTLNPVQKLAYLVPRWNNSLKCVEACLEPSYQGLAKLVTDTGSVKAIQANLVYEGDLFDVDLAGGLYIHKPHYVTGKEKGNLKGVYAKSFLSDGTILFEYMGANDIYEIRDRSESYKSFKEGKTKSCIWESDLGEMFRKTVIRRAVKYLPRTERWEHLSEAINLDEQDYRLSDSQKSFIYTLLETTTLDDYSMQNIESEISTCTKQRASEIIELLRTNQPITLDAEAKSHMASIKDEIGDGEMTDRDNEIIEEIMTEVRELKTATEVKTNSEEFIKNAGLKGISNAGREVLKNAINSQYLIKKKNNLSQITN